MPTSTVVAQHFPWVTTVSGEQVAFRLMKPQDRDAVHQFIVSLPESDLFYLMDDTRKPGGMARWIEGIQDHSVITVLAESGTQLLGYGSVRRGRMKWNSHLGEMRIMVAPAHRGKGIGALLGKEVFAAAHDLGLCRIVARITSTQAPARYMFQHLGFHIEALLADCVIDQDGRMQDLIIMSYDVSGFHG